MYFRQVNASLGNLDNTVMDVFEKKVEDYRKQIGRVSLLLIADMVCPPA